MSWQNIPLKVRKDFGDLAEFRPQRLFAFELRRWEAQLGRWLSVLRQRWSMNRKAPAELFPLVRLSADEQDD